MNNLKRRTVSNRITTIVAIIAFALMLIFSFFGPLSFGYGKIKAHAQDSLLSEDFTPANLNLTNGSFSDFSGSFPHSPSSWTERAAVGVDKGSTVAGVLDLSTFNTTKNIETSKLDLYTEYKDGKLPKTPFGTGNKIPGDDKFLMLNTTTSTTTTVNYTSASVNLTKNKFYMISAWVKTGNFADNTGASIRLNNLDGNYAFSKINTVANIKKNSDGLPDLDNDVISQGTAYGWRPYNFYIQTSPLKSYDMTISLGIGDYYNDSDTLVSNNATGYAFFDNVTAYEISASDYNIYSRIGFDPDYNMIIDLSLESAFAAKESDAFNFVDKLASWSPAEGNANGIKMDIISADGVGGLEHYGLEENPVSSTGNSNNNTSLDNILLISTYDNQKDRFDLGSFGLKSPELTIDRLSYYRLSAWVYTSEVTGGNGASLIVETDKVTSLATSDKDEEYQKFSITNAAGDESNASRYGWQEYAFYIQGSAIRTAKITMELRLGSENAKSSGTVLFHNIRFDKLTNSQFTSYSSNGTVVNFDNEFGNNNKGVTNGAFMTAGDFDEYKFPLAPASWSYIDAGSASTSGYSNSTAFVDNDNILHGIVPTDKAHFEANYSEYAPYSIINPINDVGNMLVIASNGQTAIGYRSSDITVTANTSYRLSVTLRTDRINGYGANLVLKNSSNKVIASIENIQNTYSGSNINGFETFEFYIEGGLSDTSVKVDIWLGLIDRADNITKLSSGNVYVTQVACEALAEGEKYTTFEKEYYNAKATNSRITAAAYTFKNERFDAYDYYDTNFIKYPYNWSVAGMGGADVSTTKYGIFNAANLISGQSDVPLTFKNKDAASDYVLMLYNVAPTASRLSYGGSFTFAANSWYRVSVTIKVDLPHLNDNAIGAGIELTNTDYKFENIRSTAEVIDEITDNEVFKTYDFYIANTGAETTSGISITLGDNKYTSSYAAGKVYINNIEFVDITDALYQEMTANSDGETLNKAELLEHNRINAVINTKTDSEDPDDDKDTETPNEINWWLVPSILFSAALLIAILGAVIRRIVDKVAKKRHISYEESTTYDRNKTIKTMRPDGKIIVPENDRVYEEFDDVLPPAPNKLKPRVAKVETEAVTQTEENVQVETAQTEQVAEPIAEKTEQPAQEATTQEPKEFEKVSEPVEKKVPDAYTDEFDD